MKKNVAVVWGGYSSEIDVSERSADGICSFMDKEKYNIYRVKITREAWQVEYRGEMLPIDKNDFSFTADGWSTKFDFAYITIHGTPGEDGTLQGYFDMLGIPYSSCGVLASALTLSKYTCNNYLKSFGIKVADSIILRRHSTYNTASIVAELGLPLFVKPNAGGSSYATNKVKDAADVEPAIQEAFGEAHEVLIESFISGREVTCGCYKTEEGLVALPLSEVVTKNEFFDYNAKYRGDSDEITPARIPDDLTEQIQKLSLDIYELIGAKGIVRIDYIISDGTPILLEVNTTPGMTSASFIPQQVTAAGMSMTNLLSDVIEYEYAKAQEEKEYIRK